MGIRSVGEQQGVNHTRAWWIAVAACVWAVIVAGLSFFWAAGGKTGLQPLEQAGGADSWLWVVANVVAGVGKLLMGVGALAVVSGWRPRSLLKPLRILVWVVGVGMLLYGGLGLVSDALHVTGIINDPATRKWFLIYLVLWDPWWVLGGVLFTALAWWTRPQRLPRAAMRSRMGDC
jgi:hypothetical protein